MIEVMQTINHDWRPGSGNLIALLKAVIDTFDLIMCGRYGRRADKQRIAEWMQAHDTNVFDDSYFAPSFNVAPRSMQPVVR